MPEHFTRNTVSAAFWCRKCQRETQHRIDDRRKGPCLDCIARLEAQHTEPRPLTDGYKRILWEHFKSEACPVCRKPKQSKWCFCRSCYFALKHALPKLASGLYAPILNGTDEFWENYASAKKWLEEHGHADPTWKAAPKSGELFA